jgi:hypothetical protein
MKAVISGASICHRMTKTAANPVCEDLPPLRQCSLSRLLSAPTTGWLLIGWSHPPFRIAIISNSPGEDRHPKWSCGLNSRVSPKGFFVWPHCCETYVYHVIRKLLSASTAEWKCTIHFIHSTNSFIHMLIQEIVSIYIHSVHSFICTFIQQIASKWKVSVFQMVWLISLTVLFQMSGN